MNTPHLKLNDDPKSLHAWWRLMRGMTRLQIRRMIEDYYGIFPRLYDRYCPVVAEQGWTHLEPGPSGATLNGKSDDKYFPSIRWKVSGIASRKTAGGGVSKKMCWMGSYTGSEPPHTWEIRRGKFTAEECLKVREAMVRLNRLVAQYQAMSSSYIACVLQLKELQAASLAVNLPADHALTLDFAGLPTLPGRYQSVQTLEAEGKDEDDVLANGGP